LNPEDFLRGKESVFCLGCKNTIDAKMKLFRDIDRDYYCQEEIDSILEGFVG